MSFKRVPTADVLSVEKTQEKRRETDGWRKRGGRRRESERKVGGWKKREDMSYFDIPTATAILAYEFPF